MILKSYVCKNIIKAILLQDYSTLLRDYRVFYVKLPTFEIHPELVRTLL